MSERNLKETIIALLKETHLLSVNGIIEKLAVQGKNYNKTSIYRALEQLERENIVCRHNLNESEAFFELFGDEHIHLVCTNCGKISSSEEHIPTLKNVEGFSVEHQHVTLLGKCKDCLALEN